MAAGTPSNVIDPIGPGTLYVAAFAFTGLDDSGDRTDFLAAPDTPVTGLRKVGYTDAGLEYTASTTSEDVEVAEEIDVIGSLATKRLNSAKFTMAEPTIQNLALAFGGGAAVATPGAGVGWEPPAAAAVVPVQLWHLTQSGALWRFHRAIPEGDLTLAAQKAPNKRMIPVTMKLGAGASGKPFIVYPDADGLI